MTPLTIAAPAKVNLFLRVLGKREDGFHDIDSLMVKLPGLADQLEFAPADAFGFGCDDPALPTDSGNLVVRAAEAYAAAAGIECRCRIALTKRIPHAAGLGGGSSDAAATLIGLDRLHDGLLGPDRLAGLAAGLGSDVPFFLAPGAARCTGRGERIEPATCPSLPLLLLKPAFGVDTAWAYSRWQEATPLPGVRYEAQQSGELTLVNDLECPVFQKFIFLAELKHWLLARSEVTAALLCGSGSTLLAVLRDADAAPVVIAAARQELDPELWAWCGATEG
jgi:4-diphosphocytidyl-2-C-methyl-D-erythritol kinase